MENFRQVREKLEAFFRKYYINLVLRGVLLFIAAGLLYFIITIALEYFLWFGTTGRLILFWSFILVELLLLFKFVGIPLFKLLKISEGITEFEASQIIGNHFPEVEDKLTNLLQLEKNSEKTDLLIASIDQRSKELSPIPFLTAIDLKQNKYYLRYVLLPFLIIGGLFVAGKANVITGSFHRITDYNTAYEKPAPFSFIIQNANLKVREDESLMLQVKIVGEYIPAEVQIVTDDHRNFMKKASVPGIFEYKFENLQNNLKFKIVSNIISSRPYNVELIKVPKLNDFTLKIDYPGYTGINDEEIQGSGNITVPEGTRLSWNFVTSNSDKVNIHEGDSLNSLKVLNNATTFQKVLDSKFNYSISTSNSEVKNFEKLDYTVEVIPDDYPEIDVESKRDSINTQFLYFKGAVSDDYGISRLELVYSNENSEDDITTVPIPISTAGYDEFIFSFPGELELEEGQSYSYYFRVFDNDGYNGSKSARSSTYAFRKRTADELQEERLEEQNQTILKFDDELKKFDKNEQELEEITKIEKESQDLNYNEKKKLQEFVKRQEQKNEMMQNYSEKLKKSFDENKTEDASGFKEELSRRMEENERRLEESEALLKELEEYSEKFKKEDLGKKLDELSNKNKNNKRNLEQLLELTKRYYVQEKKQKLARDLEQLATEQENASKESEQAKEKQEALNEEFNKFQEQFDELEEENDKLQNPQDLGREQSEEEEIKKDQQEAKKNLENNQQEEAKKKQKEAAEKMKQMSSALQQMAQQQSMQQMEVDAEVLRQILDNLMVFSFGQENLMNVFNDINQSSPRYAGSLRKQNELRENFNHIDDSLYALALRNPMINEKITEKLGDVAYDMEQALERLSENQVAQGTASQRYVVTGTNDLANLLDNILSSMQNMMSNPQSGSGEGEKEFQLGDIIQQQEQLQQKMEEKMQPKPNGQEGQNERGQKHQSEGSNGELFEIYKEQQMLRLEMEKILEQNAMKSGESPAEKMEQIEEDLLNKGINPETLERMQQLQYELMKFEKAMKIQGMVQKRRSDTNQIEYNNSLKGQIERAKEYFNSTEILNRQVLPLRQIYREKVKDYFGKRRD